MAEPITPDYVQPPPLSADTIARARQTITRLVVDPREKAELLSMLALHDDPEESR
ncbi:MULTISPECIES: hypothetical protein [Frankia]|uniref:Uncharacterized protein n=1 Tax=Frankia umida TaxID=573489 RepID=A0ABT0JYK4_9ACTN|nr:MULTISPECIES: hypothetical protein [Frankia]MCK9876630.1 hypothetical protein [Frankia umida]